MWQAGNDDDDNDDNGHQQLNYVLKAALIWAGEMCNFFFRLEFIYFIQKRLIYIYTSRARVRERARACTT